MTELSWNALRGEGPPTLEALRRFVAGVARDLDTDSRYVSELLGVLEACGSLEDYLRHLQDRERAERFRQDGSLASRGERGYSWLDDQVWSGMDLFERTLSNLLTGETRMMWAGEGTADFQAFAGATADDEPPLEVLSVPCSTGKEVFSLVVAGLLAGRDVHVVGVDRQPAYVARAREGLLVPHRHDWAHPRAEEFLTRDPAGPARVRPEVMARCRFEVGDVLTGELPAGPFDLVSCRNLLGYFRGESLETAWRNVASRVRPGGLLLHDPFVSGGEPMAPVRRLLEEEGFRRLSPQANYYRAARA